MYFQLREAHVMLESNFPAARNSCGWLHTWLNRTGGTRIVTKFPACFLHSLRSSDVDSEM